MELTPELVEDVMKYVDKDQSGSVSQEEFVHAIAKRSTRRTTEEKVHKTLVELVPKHHHKHDYALNPHSDFMHIWDLLVVFFLIWTATVTIFEICFLPSQIDYYRFFVLHQQSDRWNIYC